MILSDPQHERLVTESVSVVVVGYNGDRWLPSCLKSLEQASVHRLQLVLVDNHNNPCIASLDLSAFDVDVIETPRPMGFAEANNFGLLKTRFRSDLTVFLNQDTVGREGWIDAVVAAFGDDPGIGVMCPALRTYEFEEWEPNLLNCLHDSGIDSETLSADGELIRGLKHVTGSAMVIRTSVLQQTGPFDPIYGSYYEDFDLCRRVRAAGYEIAVCRSASVGHFQGSVSTDPAERERREAMLIRNRLIYRLRDCSGSRVPLLLRHCFLTLPRSLIRGVLRTPSSQSVRSTLAAHLGLLKLSPRLLRKSADEAAWQQFLIGIDWNRAERHCT